MWWPRWCARSGANLPSPSWHEWADMSGSGLGGIQELEAVSSGQDGRFVVMQSQPWMAEGLTAVQRAYFPDLAEAELMGPGHYRQHLHVFPEGQFAVRDSVKEEVAACSTDLQMNVDFAHYPHPYMQEVGHNTLSTHQPKGEWLYGADIGVHPDYQSQGLSTLLYSARQALVRQLGLRGHVAGAMPKGYGKHAHEPGSVLRTSG